MLIQERRLTRRTDLIILPRMSRRNDRLPSRSGVRGSLIHPASPGPSERFDSAPLDMVFGCASKSSKWYFKSHCKWCQERSTWH